jgi:mRNA interferase MazF
MNFSRYDIHWVDLDPVRGGEMSKRRPAVIVSLDVLNRALKTVVICPITSQLHPDWRSRLQIQIKGRPSEIACDQIRVVTKERVGKKLHSLSPNEAAALRRLLGEMYGEV